MESKAQVLDSLGVKNVEPSIIHGDKGRTDFIKAVIPDLAERRMAEMPTLGVIGGSEELGAA